MVSSLTFKQSYLSIGELAFKYAEKIDDIHQQIENRTVIGSENLGWRTLPNKTTTEEIQKINEVAASIRDTADIVIVIGVGGSYLGSKAVLEALTPFFEKKNSAPEIVFAGHNLSGSYLRQLLEYIEEKEVVVVVISKSGTTTEPAISFRLIYEYLEERYGDKVKNHIIAITDQSSGALRTLSNQLEFTSFSVPNDIGGRFSVLSPVGLLPIAIAGIDISELILGAQDAFKEYTVSSITKNEAYQYAALRKELLDRGLDTEILASFTPNFLSFHEWWKQLFGESEGKNHQGIFPASVTYPTDLHSLGQYIQEGKRSLFETIIEFQFYDEDCDIPTTIDNLDNLNYLANQTVNEINDVALYATIEAHIKGGIPVNHLTVKKQDAYHMGYLLYFFKTASMMSAYLLGVNPFDQPGVEEYKNNMFRMLEKPGYEVVKS